MFDRQQVFSLLEDLEQEQIERYEAVGFVTRHLDFEDGEIRETYALTDPGQEYFLG